MTTDNKTDETSPVAVSEIRKFWNVNSLGGILLIVGMLGALLMANSPLDWLYHKLLEAKLAVTLEKHGVAKPLLLWVNDGLMALFFLLIALEIKHEFVGGGISGWRQVLLPGAAALGGILVPAVVYIGFTFRDPSALRGWAVPTATDIAFSLAALGVLGARVPRTLKTFLMMLAVFDDIGAILIIAVFYAGKMSLVAHGLAALMTAVLVLLNYKKVTALGAYFVVGSILWLCVLKSGVHATIAGVVVGLSIPMSPLDAHGLSPLKHVEKRLHPWVSLLVLPVFAFANAGVDLGGVGRDTVFSPVTLGVFFGLVVGKVTGAFLVSSIVVRLGWATLPEGANWPSLFGVCTLAGIGFTMSMFIGTLAFEGDNPAYAPAVRIGILGGSLVSCLIGLLVLRLALKDNTRPG